MSEKKTDQSKSLADPSIQNDIKSDASKTPPSKDQKTEKKPQVQKTSDTGTDGAAAAAKKPATADKSAMPKKAKERPSTTASGGGPSQPVNTTGQQKNGGGRSSIWFIVIIILLIVVGAAVWYVHNNQEHFKTEFQQQLQSQLSNTQQSRQQIDSVARQAENSQRALKRAQEQIALLEDQVSDLSQALQVMTDSGSELMLLNDVAHFIDLAQQQLLVGGNVSNAIIPLETAQARLVRSDRQGLAILLQAINGDLDRLRAVEKLDMPATLKQLETLHTWLAEAPLLTPQNEDLELFHPHNTASEKSRSKEDSADQEWWKEGVDIAQNWAQRAWSEFRSELGELVSVRRVDDATVLLMTPEQVQGLREHIRLRISMAQLALMTQQNEVWQMELDALQRLVEKRFDLTAAVTQRALGSLRELQSLNVRPELPNLENTLAAVENLRQRAAQLASASERQDMQAAAKVRNELQHGEQEPAQSQTSQEAQQTDQNAANQSAESVSADADSAANKLAEADQGTADQPADRADNDASGNAAKDTDSAKKAVDGAASSASNEEASSSAAEGRAEDQKSDRGTDDTEQPEQD